MKLFGKKGPARPGRKDFDRLALTEKSIVFYAEDRGSWPHLAPVVEALTSDLGRTVCYLTSDDDDPVLDTPPAGVRPFAIGEGVGRAFLFKTMEAGVVVATVPQLGIPVLPRSQRAAALGMQYVYVFHSMASTHMIYEPDGFDHYDTVCCVGPYMIDEIRARESAERLSPKELVEHGYGRLDTILASVADSTTGGRVVDAEHPNVLVAPSWGPTCILETVGVELVEALLDGGCRVTVRPHPMTKKRSPDAWVRITRTFAGRPDVTLDEDIAAAASLAASDVMVSDWSGAALEYAFGFLRPVLFVDTERKVNNPDYESLGIEPFEVEVREQIGRVIAPSDLAAAAVAARDLAAAGPEWAARLAAVRDERIFNVGSSGRIAAAMIAAKADAVAAGGGSR
jgi:hypothetical protein